MMVEASDGHSSAGRLEQEQAKRMHGGPPQYVRGEKPNNGLRTMPQGTKEKRSREQAGEIARTPP
ncbi:MAG: hypothetical protein OXC91_05840 [Rhodobacteraceae bacterium]|nr:hypothetical protein [Paracoccaceae bacterium]